MQTAPPPKLIVHFPSTAKGADRLARCIAQLHADAVIEKIQSLNCPTDQKMALLDSLIAEAAPRRKKP